MEILKIKKLHPDAHVPTRAHDTDAGMDLYALPIQYTEDEKAYWKETVNANVTYAKFIDVFGSAFGYTSHNKEYKDAINAIDEKGMKDSDWDEFFNTKIVIKPHKTVMIPTGLAIAVPTGYMGCIYARSGLASKQSLAPANCVGVVDSSYRGEIKVALHNYSDTNRVIDVGDRIAQLVIQPISLCTPVEVEELDETDRGIGGFGSSGAK